MGWMGFFSVVFYFFFSKFGLTLFPQGACGKMSGGTEFDSPKASECQTRHSDAVHLARCSVNFEFEGLLRAKGEIAASECRESQKDMWLKVFSCLTGATISILFDVLARARRERHPEVLAPDPCGRGTGQRSCVPPFPGNSIDAGVAAIHKRSWVAGRVSPKTSRVPFAPTCRAG